MRVYICVCMCVSLYIYIFINKLVFILLLPLRRVRGLGVTQSVTSRYFVTSRGRFVAPQRVSVVSLVKKTHQRYRSVMATITFDAEELIGKLDAIRSSQLPYAGRRANVPARHEAA